MMTYSELAFKRAQNFRGRLECSYFQATFLWHQFFSQQAKLTCILSEVLLMFLTRIDVFILRLASS